MADLTWKVSGITYCSGHNNDTWVHVSPSTGTEETQLVVSVDQSSGGSSDCSAATITISASTGDIQYIPVTRCLRECDCKSMAIEGITSTSEISACGTDKTQFGTYDKNCSCATALTVSSDDINIVTNVWTDNGKIYGSVSKNPNESTRTAKCNVFINRHICKSLELTQAKLIGSYSVSASSRTVITAVTASRTSSETFGCAGGTYSATGTKYYDTYTTYKWKDICGDIHNDKTQERQTGTGASESLGSKSSAFSSVECDCNDDYSRTAKLEFSAGGKTASVTFKQTCDACPDDPKCGSTPVCNCTNLTVTPVIDNIAAEGGDALQIATYSVDSECTISTISATLTEGSSFVSSLDASNGKITANFDENEDEEPRTFGYELKIKYEDGSETYTCSDGYGGTQEGAEPGPKPCDGWGITLNGGPNQYYYQDYEGSGGTPVNFFVKDGDSTAIGDLTTDDFEVIIPDEYQTLFTGFEVQKADPAPQAPYLLYLYKAGIDIVCPYVGESMKLELRLKDCHDVKTDFYVIIGEVDNWNLKIDGAKSDQNSLYFGFYAHVKVGDCDKVVHMGEVQTIRKTPDDGNLYATLKL